MGAFLSLYACSLKAKQSVISEDLAGASIVTPQGELCGAMSVTIIALFSKITMPNLVGIL